ncbi:MAG: hypothetical protein IPJ47_09710 [Anaerolineales bacterium]|nr:hypothetical protein [Anaerolineales bacterium]
MRKGLLLYNPAAGRFPVRRFVRGIIKPLTDAGWSIDIAETLSGTHAVQTAHQAARENYDAVFAIGGDGTVGRVASGLVHTETALGVIPAGTVNVWALEQGQKPFSWIHPGNLRENAKRLANVEPQYVDVGDCNDQPFLLWAGIGLDAQTISKIEPRPRIFKHMAVPHFFVTTVWEATFWQGLDLRVYAEDKLVEGRILVAVATNIRHYAGACLSFLPMPCLTMAKWIYGCSAAKTLQIPSVTFSISLQEGILTLNMRAAFRSKMCALNPMRTFPFKWMATQCSAVTRQRSRLNTARSKC